MSDAGLPRFALVLILSPHGVRANCASVYLLNKRLLSGELAGLIGDACSRVLPRQVSAGIAAINSLPRFGTTASRVAVLLG